MEIAFETEKLRDLCGSEQKAKRELGKNIAEKLKRRLADLRAAGSVDEVISGNMRAVGIGTLQHMAIDISRGVIMTFCSNHAINPQLCCGGIDWSKVTRIRIVKIENARD